MDVSVVVLVDAFAYMVFATFMPNRVAGTGTCCCCRRDAAGHGETGGEPEPDKGEQEDP
ncbi:MAG: hypothetical protein KDA29_14695 [Phycisphaerales bacterium]|nr:hypothetical protein [Phycisphaerales bacterium]